ncbi:hypothetical protein EIN_184730 [Entamoeba invadens IP1]|uniref:hypothetical protein n=1 Tax=Entamoeba invadens IP1 TaxID=370355 RepID=UPI0002C3D408|nr:hypothetical protein EIN_184730 [Entamoeba invadens IP1]ELP94106.1 hypothetical protein EIN_184730 [Entamoeba invadens IP1]|eukprot:XP_004260877.1 hypothetical protein EIN_184730 [Entamoeba invadens IP1]
MTTLIKPIANHFIDFADDLNTSDSDYYFEDSNKMEEEKTDFEWDIHQVIIPPRQTDPVSLVLSAPVFDDRSEIFDEPYDKQVSSSASNFVNENEFFAFGEDFE